MACWQLCEKNPWTTWRWDRFYKRFIYSLPKCFTLHLNSINLSGHSCAHVTTAELADYAQMCGSTWSLFFMKQQNIVLRFDLVAQTPCLWTGVGVLRQFPPCRYLSDFNIAITLVTYLLPCSYLTGVATAQLQWHPSVMNVIERTKQIVLKIENISNGEINERSFITLHPWIPGQDTTPVTGLILGLRPANERRRYKVRPSLIGWAQT